MSGFSRLMRYVLVTVLVAAALVFTITQAVGGNGVSLAGLVSGLPLIDGSGENDSTSSAPLFNFEIKPEICPSGGETLGLRS